MITFLQAIVIGIFQGVTELFPISSLAHSVLLARLFGWNNLLVSETQNESFFLSFLVALHVATAIALLIFYRKEWVKIIKGFFSSVGKREVKTTYQRLAWLIIVATIPAGLIGLIFEKTLRTQFAKPMSAAFFLIVNGFVLLAGDRLQKRSVERQNFQMETSTHNMTKHISYKRAGIIGTAQIGALFAGISRSGITMVSGLYSGLDYEDAARFSFLLATPIILAAGLYKLPGLLGSLDSNTAPQIMVGALASGVAAYFSVRFLDKYFKDRRLWPFAIYCFVFGSFMIIWQLF